MEDTMRRKTELVCCILCIRSPCASVLHWLVAVLSFVRWVCQSAQQKRSAQDVLNELDERYALYAHAMRGRTLCCIISCHG
jgi:hypothetical protein